MDRGNIHRLANAESRWRRAAELHPGDAEAHAELGRVLAALDRAEEAREALERSLTIRPADEETLGELARALAALHRLDEIVPWLERAVERAPQAHALHCLHGAMLFGLGRMEEARRSYEAAIALAPQNVHYYAGLINVRALGDAEIEALERLADAPLPPLDKAVLHFTLAKALTAQGEPERAFERQRLANRVMRLNFSYDEPRALALIAEIRRRFTAEFIRAKQPCGDASPVPVFVVGFPRSGSTLVEQVLSSHPEIAGVGEDPRFERLFLAAGRAYPAEIAAMAKEELASLGARYAAEVSAAAPNAQRIVNKTLPNFLYAGLIHLALPNARIIHVVRDAVDTCLSCHAMRFAAVFPYMYDMGEMGRYYRAYRGLMEHWRQVLPPDVLLEVRYEDLVADFDTEARLMLNHLGLAWDEACRDFHRNGRAVWSASAAQVRRPLYQSKRWRPEPQVLKPLIEALGPYAEAG